MKINFDENSAKGELIRALISNWAATKPDDDVDLSSIVQHVRENKDLDVVLAVNGIEIDIVDIIEYSLQVREEFIADKAKILIEDAFAETWEKFNFIQEHLNEAIDEMAKR